MGEVLVVEGPGGKNCGLHPLLAARGYDVDTAAGPAEALAKARGNRPRVAVVDLTTLEADRFAMLAAWRDDPALHRVPLVVCVPHRLAPEDERGLLALGADALVSMPGAADELLERVARAAETPGPSGRQPPSGDPVAGRQRVRIAELAAENARLKAEIAERKRLAGLQGAILDVLPAHVALLDADGTILAVNEAWRRFARDNGLRSPGFAVGSSYLDVCERTTGSAQAEARAVAAGLRAVLDGRRADFTAEYPCHAPGERRWFRLVATSLREVGATGAVVTHVNVTEATLAREASARSAERLALALEAAEIGFWEWDPATDRQVWDDRMYRIYGLAPGTPVDYARWTSTIVAGHPGPTADEIRRLTEAGGTQTREFRIVTGAGRLRDVFSAERLMPGGAEGVATVVGINIDITERRLHEAQVAEMKSRLETLVDHARVGILVHDDFKPLVANDELARMFGRPGKAEVLALDDCRVLFAPAERDRISAYNSGRRAGAEVPGFYAVKGVRADGAEIELENRAFQIQWGDRKAVCAMFTDVTEQRRVERQLRQAQRLEAIGQLTGGVAHDFNNLLTVILGNADLLSESLAGDADLRGLAEMTKLAAQRGAELTNRLLAFSRQQALDPKSVDVADLVSDINGLLQRAIGANIEIRVATQAGLRPALVDPSQLEAAILNLAVNARDAMPAGGLLTIEAVNADFDGAAGAEDAPVERGEYVLVSVSDNGTGMDEQTRQHAFDPFFTTKEVGKGSGLGLSMVYGFVQQSKGAVRIYSEVGLGTTVKLFLPAAPAESARGRSRGPVAPPVGGSERILAVEDDPLVRAQAVAQLESFGYRVVAAADAAEALRILQGTGEFDLLFTDIVMPGAMDGRQLADAARALRPGLRVLYTSGYSENAVTHQGRLDEGVLLLSKPYRRQELAAKVRTALAAG